MGLSALIIIIEAMILTSLFLHKVIQVYKSMDKQNNKPELIKIITKTSVLAFVSTFSTLLSSIGTAISQMMAPIHAEFSAFILSVFDLSMNFFCIILLYKDYNEWYLKICGCCDSKFTMCWNKIVQTEKNTAENQTNQVKEDSVE